MKKRVLAAIMMMIMVFASVMGVSAADSRTDEVYVSDSDEGGHYEIMDDANEFTRLENVDADVAAAIKKFNSGKADAEDLFNKDVLKAIKGKSLVGKSDVMDLVAINGGVPGEDGTHVVTITVKSLAVNAKNPVVVYYDVKAGTWKSQVPTDIDYKTGKITIVLEDVMNPDEDFWPFAVYADIIEEDAKGTSPSTTGTSSTWMLLVATAVVAMGSVVVATQKRR